MVSEHRHYCIGIALLAGLLALTGVAGVAGYDPTAPPPEAQGQEPARNAAPLEQPQVRAILRSGDRRIAFVGDAYIREGDELGFGRVEHIEPNAVVFRRNGSLVYVPVQGTDIKQNRRDQP